MKKQISEPDFIGGQGPLTKEEEIALSEYFSKKKKKSKESKPAAITSISTTKTKLTKQVSA